MFCIKCGSPINEGEKFCSVCGEKAEAAPVQQTQAEQPYGQQPYEQQPYAQQPKKSKKGLLITLSLAAVLAIAAVVLFLWPGVLTSGASTLQMKFLSDNARVFEDAFSGMNSQYDEEKTDKPFDMTMNMTMDMSEFDLPDQKLSMNYAYDEEALGMSMDLATERVKLLLLNDVLYINASGQTYGIRFKSDKDLTKPMTIKDRMTAILEGIVQGFGRTIPKTEVDWQKLLMMAVNSIDESNFKQTGPKTVLKLDAEAVIDTMKTFRDSLSKDEKLLDDLEAFVGEISKQDTDVLKKLDEAIENMEKNKAGANFEIIWTVYYEGGKPVSIDLTAESAGKKYEISFGYENKKNGNSIALEIDGPEDNSDIEYEISYKVDGDKLDFTITIGVAGQTTEMNGTMVRGKDKDTMEGDATAGTAGYSVSMTYDAIVKYGMPAGKVKDDERFKVDTESADIQDFSELAGMLGMSMFGSMMSGM